MKNRGKQFLLVALALTAVAVAGWWIAVERREPATNATQPPAVNTSPSGEEASPVYDARGFRPGAVLAFANLNMDENPDAPDRRKQFTLQIPVKRRTGAAIDVQAVVVQVFVWD